MSRRRKRKVEDPLQQLFEHFLLTRSYQDAAQFTKQLAETYLAYLDSTPAHTPFEKRQALLEDIANEAHEMLVKRMYGCPPQKSSLTGSVHTLENGKVGDALPLSIPELQKIMRQEQE